MANSVISNLITTNITQNGGIDRITATEVRSVFNAINSFIQDDVSYGTAIPFDRMISKMTAHSITGATTFTKNTTGAIPGCGTILELTANGANVPNFSDFKETSASSGWVNTAGVVNVCLFIYTGTQYLLTIIQQKTLTQLATPGSFTATPVGSSQINLTWTDVANESAYKIYFNGINDFSSAGVLTTTAAGATSYNHTGLGASSPFWYWLVAVGDGVTYSDSNTTAANASTGSAGATQLNAPTGVTLGTATSTTQPITWTDTNTSPNENSYKVQVSPAGAGTWSDATMTGLTSTGATVTGLTASTSYDYRVIAVGNGTTTTNSNPSSTVTGSTGAAGYDADATTVINAIEATDAGALSTGQKNAINARILALKAQSKWTNMVAYYGYVGGTAASHAINWKTPGTYNITWNGGITHSATGVLFDGTTGYGDTGINDNTVMNLDTFSIGGYSRTSTNNGFMMGILQTNGVYLADRNSMIVRMHDVADLTAAMTPTRTLMATRQVAAPKMAEYRDVTQLTVDSGSALGKINGNIYVGAINNLNTPGPGGFSDKSYGSMFISNDGFTSSEEATFGTDETTFQTALSRSV
jgi:hypothetical protein